MPRSILPGFSLLALLALAATGCASGGMGVLGGAADLSIRGQRFYMDGEPFDMWGIRTASASQTEALTEQLIANLDEYVAHGINAVTVFYMGSRGLNSDPFSADGLHIDAEHQRRMARIIDEAAQRRMAVVVGIFYQHAPFGLRDAEAVRNAVRTVTAALRPYQNIIINIANEQNSRGWDDTREIYDFRDPENIIELARAVDRVDPDRIVGGGGYDHEKNLVIGRSSAIDVLLFGTDRPDPNSGHLFDAFVRGGVNDKPIVNVEIFGGWTDRFERGVFPEDVQRAYRAEVDAAAERPGLYVFFHNGPWLQHPTEPIRYDLGGIGTPEDPGIRWYFHYVHYRQNRRPIAASCQLPAARADAQDPARIPPLLSSRAEPFAQRKAQSRDLHFLRGTCRFFDVAPAARVLAQNDRRVF